MTHSQGYPHAARPHCGHGGSRPGVLRRVTRAVADKLGAPRKLILALLIIGAIVNLPLTLLLFAGAWYWTDNPEAVERALDRIGAWFTKVFRPPAPRSAGTSRPGSDPKASEATSADNFDEFADLRREFEDLERRAADMEQHVASEEFELNQKFRKMADDAPPRNPSKD